MWVEAGQLLGAIDPPDLPPVLAVVVHKHVLADAQQRRGVDLQGRGHRHLESKCKDIAICGVTIIEYDMMIEQYAKDEITWKRRMSLGFPAFLRQFWLHLRKNFSWNLQQS